MQADGQNGALSRPNRPWDVRSPPQLKHERMDAGSALPHVDDEEQEHDVGSPMPDEEHGSPMHDQEEGDEVGNESDGQLDIDPPPSTMINEAPDSTQPTQPTQESVPEPAPRPIITYANRKRNQPVPNQSNPLSTPPQEPQIQLPNIAKPAPAKSNNPTDKFTLRPVAIAPTVPDATDGGLSLLDLEQMEKEIRAAPLILKNKKKKPGETQTATTATTKSKQADAAQSEVVGEGGAASASEQDNVVRIVSWKPGSKVPWNPPATASTAPLTAAGRRAEEEAQRQLERELYRPGEAVTKDRMAEERRRRLGIKNDNFKSFDTLKKYAAAVAGSTWLVTTSTEGLSFFRIAMVWSTLLNTCVPVVTITVSVTREHMLATISQLQPFLSGTAEAFLAGGAAPSFGQHHVATLVKVSHELLTNWPQLENILERAERLQPLLPSETLHLQDENAPVASVGTGGAAAAAAAAATGQGQGLGTGIVGSAPTGTGVDTDELLRRTMTMKTKLGFAQTAMEEFGNELTRRGERKFAESAVFIANQIKLLEDDYSGSANHRRFHPVTLRWARSFIRRARPAYLAMRALEVVRLPALSRVQDWTKQEEKRKKEREEALRQSQDREEADRLLQQAGITPFVIPGQRQQQQQQAQENGEAQQAQTQPREGAVAAAAGAGNVNSESENVEEGLRPLVVGRNAGANANVNASRNETQTAGVNVGEMGRLADGSARPETVAAAAAAAAAPAAVGGGLAAGGSVGVGRSRPGPVPGPLPPLESHWHSGMRRLALHTYSEDFFDSEDEEKAIREMEEKEKQQALRRAMKKRELRKMRAEQRMEERKIAIENWLEEKRKAEAEGRDPPLFPLAYIPTQFASLVLGPNGERPTLPVHKRGRRRRVEGVTDTDTQTDGESSEPPKKKKAPSKPKPKTGTAAVAAGDVTGESGTTAGAKMKSKTKTNEGGTEGTASKGANLKRSSNGQFLPKYKPAQPPAGAPDSDSLAASAPPLKRSKTAQEANMAPDIPPLETNRPTGQSKSAAKAKGSANAKGAHAPAPTPTPTSGPGTGSVGALPPLAQTDRARSGGAQSDYSMPFNTGGSLVGNYSGGYTGLYGFQSTDSYALPSYQQRSNSATNQAHGFVTQAQSGVSQQGAARVGSQSRQSQQHQQQQQQHQYFGGQGGGVFGFGGGGSYL